MHAIPLGTRVRALRRAKDWTQRQLSARAGINHITISRLEHGESAHVYAETIVALARALGCPTDYLLGMDEEEAPPPPGRAGRWKDDLQRYPIPS